MAFVVPLLPPHHHLLQLDQIVEDLVLVRSTWIPWFGLYLIVAGMMHDELHEEVPRTVIRLIYITHCFSHVHTKSLCVLSYMYVDEVSILTIHDDM